MATNQRQKIWKASKDSNAGMAIDEKTAVVSSGKNAIVVDENGITLVGPISMATDAMNIRRGGLFVGLNDFTDMIPSTIVTPIPKQIPMPPITAISNLAKDVAFFMGMLA